MTADIIILIIMLIIGITIATIGITKQAEILLNAGFTFITSGNCIFKNLSGNSR